MAGVVPQMSKEAQLRARLREAIAEKQEAVEAREGLAFDNLKLARRIAELTARLEDARHRTSGSMRLSSFLSWGDTPPPDHAAGEELLASLQENESLQAALIDVQHSHESTLRLQNVQQRAELIALVIEIERAEVDIGHAVEHGVKEALEAAEAEKQVLQLDNDRK